MKYGYIFDFDGVLSDNMELHFLCNQRALAEVGVAMDKKQYFYQAGMTGIEQIKYFCSKAGVETDYEKVYRRKKELFMAFIDKIVPIENNVGLLKILQANGYPVAIATGSSRSSLLPAMKQCDIHVDVYVTSEDVKKGKPDPELFLTAAQRLGVAPEYCIVIEDSDVGIEAAKAAGMKAMRFYNNKIKI